MRAGNLGRIQCEVVCIDRIYVPGLDGQGRVAGRRDLRKPQSARIDCVDLIDEVGGEAQAGEIPPGLVRIVTVDVACVAVTSVDQERRRDGVDMVDRSAAVVAE